MTSNLSCTVSSRLPQVEDEILSEIEDRDTTIMLQNAKIEKQSAEIEKQNAKIEKQNAEIEMTNQKLQNIIVFLHTQGYSINEIAHQLNIPETEIMEILSHQK